MRFYLLREDPVQEIAAHPDTLAELVAVLPKSEPEPEPLGTGALAPLFGLPLVPDPDVRPGYVILRPFPARTQWLP